MFENLSGRLETIYKKLKGRGVLKEADVDEALREIRVALIEADASLAAIKPFLEDVREKAVGQEVLKSLTPGHQMVKIVNDELVSLLGDDFSELKLASNPPTVILMMGLQGSGKTTTVGKLANRFKQKGKNCLLVPADVYRPAAIEQLNVIGRDLEIKVYQASEEKDPVRICAGAVDAASKEMIHVVILDTAGRLQIDDELMAELKAIKEKVNPHESLFVADAMMGQQAADVAGAFNEAIGIDGVILTKMDGDARGGAALSVREVTGKPIKFLGIGEDSSALEPFHPDRVASRILGMGDVVGLVEEVQRSVDQEKAQKISQKLKKGKGFDLEDFRDQLFEVEKMGGLGGLMDKIPGMSALPQAARAQMGGGETNRLIAMINSMTPGERAFPAVIKGSRKRRIAAGSGTQVQEVNRLLKQFTQMQKMMKKMKGKGGMAKLMGQLKGGGFPGGGPSMMQ